MALGLLDDYLNKPSGDPELELYPVVSELLSQRARAAVAAGSQPVAVRVVGWLNAEVAGVHGHRRLDAISVRDSATGREQTEPADGLSC
jgi:hypothetical protein